MLSFLLWGYGRPGTRLRSLQTRWPSEELILRGPFLCVMIILEKE
nr:MAG TPA_asm: hypothetical protein [Caudoviricetes sp.]